ncbi:MAG: helix-hairpin-helix domain-containing protein [Acidimicrobiales bacterium]|nr:helix-hairpin-helix domain-containing protein [Acidimicrobiales bacterium]
MSLADRLRALVGAHPLLVGWAIATALVAAVVVQAARPDTPPPPEVSVPLAQAPTAAPTATPAPAVVVVHVAGAVVVPGVYELTEPARVTDAVAIAGGTAPDADLERVNLAAPVTDGARVWIPAIGEADVPVPVGVSGSGAEPGGAGPDMGPIDLNAADTAALDALPGVGPATATAIISYREEHGTFGSVDELLDVPGIGPAKLEALRDLVVVS